MQKRLSYKKFIKYLTRKDFYTPLFVRYLHLLSASYYPTKLDGDKILDIGCGKGEFVSLLNIKNKISLGIDKSQAQINLAKRTGNYQKVIKANISDLPKIINKKYKIILCNSVLEHIKNLEKALEIIFNILDSNEKFIFTVPQKGWENHLLYSKIDKEYGKKINAYFEHINLWDKTKWEEILRKQGFEVYVMREFTSPYSCFLIDVLFTEKKIEGLKKSLYKLYINDENLCKVYNRGSLYFEATHKLGTI